MIEIVKLTHNIYDDSVSPQLSFCTRSNTRGNKYKLLNHTFHYDLRKHFFTACIVNIWNSLPNLVVDANSVNAFKACLDKFWLHQEVMNTFIHHEGSTYIQYSKIKRQRKRERKKTLQ